MWLKRKDIPHVQKRKSCHFTYAIAAEVFIHLTFNEGVISPKSYSLFYSMSCFAWTVITRYHRLGGFNNRHVLLIVLEAEKSNKLVPASLALGEGSLTGEHFAVSSHSRETQREQAPCCLL